MGFLVRLRNDVPSKLSTEPFAIRIVGPTGSPHLRVDNAVAFELAEQEAARSSSPEKVDRLADGRGTEGSGLGPLRQDGAERVHHWVAISVSKHRTVSPSLHMSSVVV